jgi:hypothetical protein
MRALVPKALAILALLGLAACVLPQGGAGQPKGPNPVTGGEIEVTALDDPAPAPKADTRKAGKTERPDPVAAVPAQAAGPEDPRPKPRPPPEGKAAPDAPVQAPEEAVPAPEAAVADPGTPKSDAQKACEKRGDLWTKLPDSQAQTCVKRTKDAGKSCTTSKECDGECLARSGTCAPYTPLFGCNEILQDDGRRMTLCLD